jgi:hypothetical protein
MSRSRPAWMLPKAEGGLEPKARNAFQSSTLRLAIARGGRRRPHPLRMDRMRKP